jgi:hypothetical protein
MKVRSEKGKWAVEKEGPKNKRKEPPNDLSTCYIWRW